MFLASLTAVIIFQVPSPGEEAWALKLGKERSQYGDIPNSGLWKHGYTGQFGGTYIMFRAGSSTERYYFTTSPGADRWRISRTTRVKGKICKDWMIFIDKGPELRIKTPGPLWMYAGGGKVVGTIPKNAMVDLQNQVPLAQYHSNVHASYCTFVGLDGKESEYTSWDPDFSKLPRTKQPYPITLEERQYVYRKG